MCQRVVRSQLHEPFVNLQPVGISAFERQQVAHYSKHIDIVGQPAQDAPEEFDFKVDLARITEPRLRRTRRNRFVPFVGVLARMRHGLPPARSEEWTAPQPIQPGVPSLIITGAKGSAIVGSWEK